ncbi:MAG: hypothetical protein PHY99_00870 [Bacteroidales bacterium]|nr:hypothetical protein [Bacteroidales bacterium]
MNQATAFMTRLKRSAISLSGLLLMLSCSLSGQDIFDGPHSREFARYLMYNHQFRMAADEWERVLFLNPQDTQARLSQIKSYRLSQNPAEGWKKLILWYPTGPLPQTFASEAMQLALMQNDFPSFRSVLARSPGLPAYEKSNFELGAWLLEGSWIKSPRQRQNSPIIVTATDTRLLQLFDKSMIIRRKSPALAVALSSVVPGLGKIYSHDWKDGLLSLLFVATNAWQSYRGFSKNGTGSVTGWVFGTLAFGFYSADLFGSWKSADLYNSKQVDLIRHETEAVIYTH